MSPSASETSGAAFAAVGTDVTVHPHTVFVLPERIRIGSRVVVSEFVWVHGGRSTTIGSFVHLSNHASIAGGGVAILEDFVGLSAGARLITGTELVHGEGLTNPTIPAEYRAVRRSFVHLERHVFLGTNAVVQPGITIGEGAVLGAGAVATRDLAPWTVNVGVPARPVGERPGETITRLAAALYAETGIAPLDATPLVAAKRDDVQRPER